MSGAQRDALLRRQQAAVGLEWRLRLAEAWEDATPAARARALDVFAGPARRTRPVHAAPELADQVAAVRRLRAGGAELPPPAPLERVVSALDLRATPGAFAPVRRAAEPPPVTVHVWPLLQQLAPADVDAERPLTLSWIAPDGERLRARTEPVAPAAWRDPGFEMYLRAPRASAPGPWRLVAEVETPEGVHTCEPIEVPCARAVQERLAALETEQGPAPRGAVALARAELLAAVALAVRHGVRLLPPLAVEPALALLEGEPWPRSGQGAVPALGFVDDPARAFGAARVWRTPRTDREPPRLAVVVLAAGDEPAHLPLAGALGRAWTRFAEELDAVVLATDLPVAAPEPPSGAPADGGRTEPSLADVVAFAREELDAPRVVLVARRDANLRLGLALRAGRAPGVDAVVHATHVTGHGRPHRPPGPPALVVDTLAPAAGFELVEEGPRGWAWARTSAPNVLADLELPGLLATWLQA